MMKISWVFLRNERQTNKFCFAMFQKGKAECSFQGHLRARTVGSTCSVLTTCAVTPAPSHNHLHLYGCSPRSEEITPCLFHGAVGFRGRPMCSRPLACSQYKKGTTFLTASLLTFWNKNLAHRWVPLQLEQVPGSHFSLRALYLWPNAGGVI